MKLHKNALDFTVLAISLKPTLRFPSFYRIFPSILKNRNKNIKNKWKPGFASRANANPK